jgi:hypothetical protein
VPKARNILVPLSIWGEGRMAAIEMVIHVSLARSNCLHHRDGCAGEDEDRISAMDDLIVESRPIAVVMLTVGGVSGQPRPCRMEMCRGSSYPHLFPC